MPTEKAHSENGLQVKRKSPLSDIRFQSSSRLTIFFFESPSSNALNEKFLQLTGFAVEAVRFLFADGADGLTCCGFTGACGGTFLVTTEVVFT